VGEFSVVMAETARSESARGFRIPFWAQVLVGLAVGILLGFLARQFAIEWLGDLLATVGSSFVGLLRVIVVPLLTAIIVSIANLVDHLRRRLARDPVRVRVPVLDRHAAADPAGGHP
jgi:L-cystine uptake protein TcyP (sodium:dicarboxylate symporter family)